MKAPQIAPEIAPTLLLHGTSIPNVNIPNVVPAAMADNEVATSKMPPNFSTINKNTMDNAPRTNTLPLTIAFDAFSDGLLLKHPRHMSSSKTPAVEFKITDSELKGRENERFYFR